MSPRLCYYVTTSHPVFIDYELDDGTTARIVVIDTGLVSGITGSANTNPDGNPIDREAADAAWRWIDRILKQSSQFDYLFVAGHYQTVDVRGHWDAALIKHLLPKMKEANVTAYLQGHWHTMEHVQEKGFLKSSDIHFITSGSGAKTEMYQEYCNEVSILIGWKKYFYFRIISGPICILSYVILKYL